MSHSLLPATLEHLRQLVRHDTQNPPRAIDGGGLFAYVADQLADFEIAVVDHGAGCVSLLAVRGTPELLFNVHMDTVPATRHWSRDPLALSVEDGRAYGLGACDIKGAAACLLAVARHLPDADMALLLSSDEEAGDNRCISRFLETAHGFSAVVVAEPTGCRAVLAHRGIVSLRAHFGAPAGHSSEPRALADNALHQAARWVGRALAWADGAAAERFEGLAGLCFNVGTVAGGVKNNVIAPSAEVGFGLRPLPGQDPERLVAEVCALHEGPHPARFVRSYEGPALPGGQALAAAGGFDGAIARSRALATSLGLPSGPAVNFWTEAALFSAAGLPALVFGPGDIAQAHCADEWVSLAQLETALAHYERIFAGAGARRRAGAARGAP